METRTSIEVKVWTLILNPMTDRAESGRVAALAFDKESLIEFYKNEFAEEGYQDGGYNKSFKKGGPLEWFNPLMNDIEQPQTWYNHGLASEWVYQETVEALQSQFYFINK